MDIKQLEIFVSIVDNRSFTKTAQQLFLTQPTVSSHLASLERELDAQLLVRTTKEIYPSKVGEILYEYAVQILRLRNEAVNAVCGFERSTEGELVIGASSIPANYFLPKLIAGFRKLHPNVSFQVQSTDSKGVIDGLLSRRIEIGMVGSKIPTPKCVFEQFAEDRLVLITPNTEEYRQKLFGSYSIRWLIEQPFVVRESGSGTRRESEAFLREMGFAPQDLKIAAEISDTEGIKHAVAQGIGVSIVSDCVAESYRQFGKILVFPFEQSNRPRKLYLVQRKNDLLSPIARAFFNYASQHCPKTQIT